MKYAALLFLLLSGPGWDLLTLVRDRNVAVADGVAAYARGDADQAATAFAAALAAQARRAPDPRLVLNLSHAQVLAGRREEATASYGRLLTGAPAPLSSVAHQQLAVLAAGRGEVAQALGLLRQALLLDPHNSAARFDYELLSDYLARRPNTPKITAPKPAPGKPKPADSPENKSAEQNKPAEKEGTDRQGQTNDRQPAPPTPNPPTGQSPNPAGTPNPQRPDTSPGNVASGGRTPGSGAPQPLASGATPGRQRGLDRRSSAPGGSGSGNQPGADNATPADLRLQTQRERLQAMNLSPAQARQLLETLRAQEQQYLQQVARPATGKPDPGKPTW